MVPVQQGFIIVRMINSDYIQYCISLHLQSADVSIVSNVVLLKGAWLRSLHLGGFLDCPTLDGELHHVFLGDLDLVAQVVEVEHRAVCH